ncbi:hypothetical protein Tco_1338802 [Tanacetum coccineum]
MTASKTFNKHPKHKALYHALIESILADEDVMDTGVVDIQKKRKPDDADRDEDPPTRPDQGLKRRKTSKDTEQSKKAKSTGTSRGTTKSQPKSTGKSAQAEEIVFEARDTQVQQDLGEDIGGSTGRTYTTSLTKMKAAKYDLSKRQTFYGYASNKVSKHDVYSTKRILAVTNVKVNVWYGYGHLEEIEVRRSDQQLYKFMEGEFPRLYLNDIKGMLILVKRVEDLQHGVESYQKKLNISRPLTHKADITDLEPYTTYSNPQGDKLKDMLNNLEMGYKSVMLRRRWSNLDKKWSRIMVKDIDRQLLKRMLMRSLEKFVGGREYGENLRLLQDNMTLSYFVLLFQLLPCMCKTFSVIDAHLQGAILKVKNHRARDYLIHVSLMDTGIAIHMLVEKTYPLTQEMLSRMLSGKIEVNNEGEMAFELLRFTRSHIEK